MELITFSKSLTDSPEIISLPILSHSKVRNPKSLQHHIKCSLFTCGNEKQKNINQKKYTLLHGDHEQLV